GTLLPTPTAVHEAENDNASQQLHHREDEGALFVKLNGSWMHCGYHLTTSIVSSSLLSLPYALTFLGWKAGIFCLVIEAMVSFYSFILIYLVLEHHDHMGNRHLLFRDMARDILEREMGTQLPTSTAEHEVENHNVSQQLHHCKDIHAGALFVLKSKGSWMHCGYHLTTSIVGPPLLSLPYAFTFLGWTGGIFCLVIGALVTFYSYNLISLVLEHHAHLGNRQLRFRDMAHDILGNSSKGPAKDYSLKGDTTNRLFGIFNAIPIIATTYGNGIVPEIQATLAPPVKGKMLKGLCVCYTVLTFTFFSVAISGYWAFGNQAEGLVLSNLVDNEKPLVPKWFIYMTNIFTITQLSAVAVVYLQPTNVVLEQAFADPKRPEFSPRNVIPRLISRSLAIISATTMAAMLPFFGDMNSVIGAFGYMPLDFILPMIFFNVTFKPSKRSPIFWLNVTIVVTFSALGAIAAVAAVRQIILDAKTYRLFANV
ncbi:GABA transporter 1, partial [Mucuna pruriens]